jgi:glycosidase
MYDILHFWSEKGIDGFRCDMVEMVPVEFWGWVIAKLKKEFPALIIIGEAYEVNKYQNYISIGKFDYLYDKVGLYDAIRKLTCSYWDATTWDINQVWNRDTKGIDSHMLRFMENHDEQRIASQFFCSDALKAVPGMIVTATLNTGPVMIYMGQEVGEPAVGSEGFSDDNGRTSIFDYWGVPEHQKWLNNGRMDGGQLSDSQKHLRDFYSKLLNICRQNEAVREGKFWELMLANEHQPGFDTRMYLYLRYTDKQRILVITNFNREERNIQALLPADLLQLLKLSGSYQFTDLLSGASYHTDDIANGIAIHLPAMSGMLLEF